MTIGDILIQINQANLDTMLPLAAVKTSADIERYYKEGYSVGITANEFAKKYPRLPVARIYATHNMLASLYYCELNNPIIPIVLSLNIYGDKRLAVNGESDEKFQQRVLDRAEKSHRETPPSFAATSFPWKTACVYRFFLNTLSCPVRVRIYTHFFWTSIVPVILGSRLSKRITFRKSFLESLRSKSRTLKRSYPACRIL